jgi:hypothetical protein
MSAIQIAVPQEKVEAFCRKWRVKEFALFGSVLRDDFRPDSDVDVLVDLLPNHGLSLYDWVDMIAELKEMFGRDVDLVDKIAISDPASNPFRRRAILSSYKVIYAAA